MTAICTDLILSQTFFWFLSLYVMLQFTKWIPEIAEKGRIQIWIIDVLSASKMYSEKYNTIHRECWSDLFQSSDIHGERMETLPLSTMFTANLETTTH